MTSKSNIIAGSNVFLCKSGDPRYDQEFVREVQDYNLLRKLNNRRVKFTSSQEKILETDTRCTYAQNDPCWGYSKSHKKVISACINEACPIHWLRKCNPRYTSEDAEYWRKLKAQKTLYGNPRSLHRYYLVDMVSDEERHRYQPGMENENSSFQVRRFSVSLNEQDKTEKQQYVMIDPVTGKKMAVIGYRWKITDNASYENEELIPIWGFVDEAKQDKQTVYRKKAKRIEKKEVSQNTGIITGSHRKKLPDSDYDRKEEFEKAVAENIENEIRLTDISFDPEDSSDILILFDNPAELAFVSENFLLNGIVHGVSVRQRIMLALIDDYKDTDETNNTVIISNMVLKNGCRENNVKSWKALSHRRGLTKLQIVEHDYYEFSNEEGLSRWTCRNMYGVTHVCVKTEDISDLEVNEDGVYPVSLAGGDKLYMILDKNGELLGHLTSTFGEIIEALKAADEISSSPAVIQGLAIHVRDGRKEFLGMGHLKFIEY